MASNKLVGDHLIFPADRSTFVTDKAVEQLSIVAQFLALAAENPATTVAVGQIQPKDEPFSGELTEYLKQVIAKWPGFKASEVDEKPEYTIDGKVSLGAEVHISIELRSTHGDHAPGAIEASGARKAWRVLENQVARQTFAALNDMRLAQRFGENSLSTMKFEDLLREGKHLLCQDEPPACRQDPSAGIRVFQVADSRRSKADDWEVVYYLGVAQAANYKYSDAIESLKAALSRINSSTPNATKAETKVHNTLGDVYSKFGDQKHTAEEYGESLKADPYQAELYVKIAETLSVDDRRGAIKVLLDGFQQIPENAELHSALLENVRGLPEGELEPVAKVFENAFAAGVPIQNEYALLWIQRGEGGSVSLEDGRQFVSKALGLHPTDEEVRAEVYALAADMYLPGDLDRADGFLNQGEALPQQKLTPSTLNWLARLRAIYLLDRKNYEAASNQVKKAQEIAPNSLNSLLEAQVALQWADADPQNRQAKELYSKASKLSQQLISDDPAVGAHAVYINANHALGLDQESRETLTAVLKDNPRDVLGDCPELR